MNQQDQQAIDDLFRHLYRTAAQGEPRDRQAETRIQQHIQQGPPGLLYHMAQTLVGQQAALRQLRAQLADCQQQLRQGGSPAGFAQPGRQGAGQQGYGGYAPQYQPASGWQRSGGQGFLAGAGQIALGVGGGILAAEALGNLFSGDGLFGGDDYGEREYDQGYYDGRQDEERQDGGQDDGDGGYDDGGGFDDGGSFDGGGW